MDVARDREGAINDGWWDDGEGAADREGNTKNSLFSISGCGWLIRQIRGESHQRALH